MKALKLCVWLVISLGIGKVINQYLQPTELFYAILIFIIPFLVFGFQTDLRSATNIYSLFGFDIFKSTVDYERSTFWGIPINKEIKISGTYEISDKKTWEKLKTIQLKTIIVNFLPSILGLVFKKLPKALIK